MSLPTSVQLRYAADGVDFVIAGKDGDLVRDAFPLPAGLTELFGPALTGLESLWIEDRLVERDGLYHLPIEEIYALTGYEREILGLPRETTKLAVELRTIGAARSAEFRVRAIARDPQRGLLPEVSRHGAFFVLGDEVLLVDRDLADLYRTLDQVPGHDVGERLIYIGDVRAAAERCGAKLDRFLEQQDIMRPDGVGVEAVVENDAIRLRPILEGVEGDLPGFEGDESTRPAYTRIIGARRQRVVLDRRQRETADTVRRRAPISGPDVPRFLDNPEAFLPDEIDLSKYSLRVRGIVPRRYNSQPYIRAQRSGRRGWFDVSAEIELSSTGDQPQGAGDFAALPTDGTRAAGPPPESGADDAAPSISPAAYAELCRRVVETGERYQRYGNAWVEVDPEQAHQYLAIWNSLEHDESGGMRIHESRVRYVLDVFSNVEELEYSETEALGLLSREIPDYDIPGRLRADLMPHQLFGYRWLRFLLDHGYGGLLADDMGLGKTVQVISLLAFLAENGSLQPSLIVVPKSLVGNWHREIRKFCPDIRRIYHHQGPDRMRDPRGLAQAEVVITTYQTLRRDQLILGQVDWQVVACDEAQYVKNPTAQSTSATKALKAKLRLALTGTPVENGLGELWCIVDFAQPGKLGSQSEFRSTFERPMRDAEGTLRRAQLAARLQRVLYPHYVRRVKEETLQGLPPKSERRIGVPLGPRQRRLYGAVVRAVRRRDMVPLEALQRLIMIASHPELYEVTGASIEALIEECPKLSESLRVIEAVQERGEKVVVFTRYRHMQQIIHDAISHRFGTHAPIINGESASERRLRLVDQFNSAPGFRVLILSPEAAGVGLNITGANHVLHYSRLWNPAKENQATDRVHRIGQEREVTVYYPVVVDEEFTTVEKRLDELLEEKRALARDALWPRENLNIRMDEMEDVLEPNTEIL